MMITVDRLTAIAATYYVTGLGPDAPRQELTVLVGPGQDVMADVPKIISVALWADNTLTHRIKIIAMRVSDVNV